MNKQLNEMSLLMAGSGSSIYMVESFMEEHYAFRRNLLSGKTEMAVLKDIDGASPDDGFSPDDGASPSVDEKEETTLLNSNLKWEVMTKEKVNSIVRAAKKMGVGGKKSPRQDIEEYVCSDVVPDFDPIRAYLMGLPKWDGKNHVAELFSRIPGLTSEQLSWCASGSVLRWLIGFRWIRCMATRWCLY